MKKLLLSTAALALVALAAPASAADLAARPYTKAPAYAPATPIYNWTGFYIGGHIGGAFPGNDNNLLGGSNDGTFMGGVQGGYDYQFAPNWVFGLEANYSFLSTSSNFDNRGLGSVTGRLGYTWGPALLYVKGGYAWADSRFTNGFAGDGGRDGYTVGGGLEYLFTQNWSGKVEYQYYDFGNVNFITPTLAVGGFKNDEHTIKAGLNYRFNLGNFGAGFVQ
ncbi:outer membrane immunogenic protein [Tardiphaga sp. OK246]|jgi:outer membrane immunogenic protein|uniref:outer membrane protein n=1 Tax=Tardiphaga sp. OK246 TaxID=1855307 RepID=UPI000B6B336A|nr:outer membrane beta-barrel protein [Tardiphaga sp. OK246]SNT57469.1 outer membrane immunogenic protein [Tardiphaga sp. OK246]